MRLRVSLTVAALSAGLASAYGGFYLRGEPPPDMPAPGPLAFAGAPMTFDYRGLDALLSRYVDEAGLVDYAGLSERRAELELWLGLVSAYSPDSHPELFPSRDDGLAYWLNAYNAWSLYLVTEPGAAGPAGEEQLEFFVRRRVRAGGRSMSLFDLDHDIIRDRYDEPRTRFAVNFGAMGGPALQREAFRGDRLSAQLDVCAQKFCRDERRVAVRQGHVEVSALFDWYAQDFDSVGGPIAFCESLGRTDLPPDGDVTFLPFDWRLNGQPSAAPAPGVAPGP